jgi:hypothetical protein
MFLCTIDVTYCCCICSLFSVRQVLALLTFAVDEISVNQRFYIIPKLQQCFRHLMNRFVDSYCVYCVCCTYASCAEASRCTSSSSSSSGSISSCSSDGAGCTPICQCSHEDTQSKYISVCACIPLCVHVLSEVVFTSSSSTRRNM